MHDAAHNGGTKPELPRGYMLQAEGTNQLLKRPNGYLLAAFTEGYRSRASCAWPKRTSAT
jgi:hypothetical protein